MRLRFIEKVVVKFDAALGLPYEDDVARHFTGALQAGWISVRAQFGPLVLRRLVRSVPPDRLRDIDGATADQLPADEAPELLTFHQFDRPAGVALAPLLAALRRLPGVDRAYRYPNSVFPSPVTPMQNPRFANQGYLQPGPTGINAVCAWHLPGGDGKGQSLVDLEGGWHSAHPDFGGRDFGQRLHGDNSTDLEVRAHGTATLGVICAADNAIGTVGCAPGIQTVRLSSLVLASGAENGLAVEDVRPDAFMAAVDFLNEGDILLVEAQLDQHTDPDCGGTWEKVPLEANLDDFQRIKSAVLDRKIIVVEPAGNKGIDLGTITDACEEIFVPGTPGYRNYGLMVAAGTRKVPREQLRMGEKATNYGGRIDCHAWGEWVDTLSTSPATTDDYTDRYDGTSAASAVIAGALACLQGMALEKDGQRLSPEDVRTIVRAQANGTMPWPDDFPNIGIMPDLGSIAKNELGLAPDVYARDHVGDVGEPHDLPLARSPDIIVRRDPAPLADPQGTYGEGTGTENDDMLSSAVRHGEVHHLYIRARNRGQPNAGPFRARVYWAPPATLVTPDQWNRIGETDFDGAPAGGELVVSKPLRWDTVPGPGHYCFIADLDDACAPGEALSNIQDWPGFIHHVRTQNNLTWRNFDVEQAPAGIATTLLPMNVNGSPWGDEHMMVLVLSRLPAGSRLEAIVDAAALDRLGSAPRFTRLDAHRVVTRLRIPRGVLLDRVLPAKLQLPVTLRVELPRGAHGPYEIALAQAWRGIEVGRVTRRLVPKR